MRAAFSIAIAAALAGCGEEEKKAEAPPPPPNALPAGAWQSTSEVTHFRQLDDGRPRLNMPVGTRTSGEGCVAEGAAQPPPGLFAGSDFRQCRWWAQNFYMRNGRLSGAMTCRRDGVGEVNFTVEVRLTETSFEGELQFGTLLPTDGDVTIVARTQGRRSGACTAAAEGGNQTQSR